MRSQGWRTVGVPGEWLLAAGYVMNVVGGGDIANMWVKGSKTGWIIMNHNWGASYQAFATLEGQSLSFKLTSYTSHETIIALTTLRLPTGVPE